MSKSSGSNWITSPSSFANAYGVDAVNHFVYANITNFGSIFAPMGTPAPVNCPVITSPGTYSMGNDYTGAPNDESELNPGYKACVKIAAPDNVLFDCNGYSITNDGTINATGILVNGSASNVTVTGCDVSQYSEGVYLLHTSNDSVINTSIFNNSLSGMDLAYSSNNNVSNDTVYGDLRSGFAIFTGANNNTLTHDSAFNNTEAGYYIDADSYNYLFNDTAYDNGLYGMHIESANATNATSLHFYNNTEDLYMSTNSTPRIVYLTNISFDSPADSYQNHTRLDIVDTLEANSGYQISWASNTSALPASRLSFSQKFVNISAVSGAVSIDSITFDWRSTELAGYNSSRFELWQFNSSGWTMLNNTPDTSANTLSLNNMNPGSIYGILQNNPSNCPVLSSPGAYAMGNDYVGAPNDASEIVSGAAACVKIATSNVLFDCNGYNITNDVPGRHTASC